MFLGITLLALLGIGWTIVGGMDSFAARRNANIPRILFYQGLLTIIIGIVTMLIQKEPLDWKTHQFLFIAGSLVLSGIAAYLANFFLCLSMSLGPNGIIWSIYQAAMLVPFALGITIHHDPLTIMRTIGLLLLLTGLMALGIGGDIRKKKKGAPSDITLPPKRLVWLIPAFLAFLTNGLSMYTIALPSRFQQDNLELSSIARSTLLNLGLVLGSIVHGFFKKDIIALPTKIEANLSVIFILLGLINYYALQFPGLDLMTAAGAGAIALTIPVGVCVSAFTIYSALRLKEKYTPLEWTGLVACTIGVVVITF